MHSVIIAPLHNDQMQPVARYVTGIKEPVFLNNVYEVTTSKLYFGYQMEAFIAALVCYWNDSQYMILEK